MNEADDLLTDLEPLDEWLHESSEYFKGEALRELRLEARNKMLFNFVKKIKGIPFYNALKDIIEGNDYTRLSAAKKPVGKWQKEHYKALPGLFITQRSSYPCEDCYTGILYVPLRKNLFLRVEYAC